MRGATLPTAERDDSVRGIFKDIGGNEFARGSNERGHLNISERRDFAERVDGFDEANL